MTWGVDEHISVAEVLQYVMNLPTTPLSYPTEKKGAFSLNKRV
eukprot:CAMPEP_0181122984 /NCGR_PEP_ID=MMETSP1071-20121207/25621_1 /TAXON_ID=35127 /ORGANISM="Thalassiosira sp., Strain NH16" /LENGTH=42 /DNA_ID= /DNA_START= /DNA_END= /DNA_ORIENTATION=